MSKTVIVIFLLLVVLLGIYAYGSTTDPYDGTGIFYSRMQNEAGTQWLDSIIRYEPNQGTKTTFTMYNIIYDSEAEDAVPVSVAKTSVHYIGVCYKEVVPNFYLRPTGIHFPVLLWDKGTKAVINWTVEDTIKADADGNLLEPDDYGTKSYRSQIVDDTDTLLFDRIVYTGIDTIPPKTQKYIDMIDSLAEEKAAVEAAAQEAQEAAEKAADEAAAEAK